jgi:hypothetical protein
VTVHPPSPEEHLARALRALPAAPEGWVAGAKELPALRAQLDGLVARAEADAAFRAEVLADLERAVAAAGLAPDPHALAALKARLQDPPPD